MKRIIVILSILLFVSTNVNATNLRGQIAHATPSGAFNPVANVKVDIYLRENGKWKYWSCAYTGNDGFYYFVNFSPGTVFCLKVSGRFYPPQPLVISKAPIFDIPRIVI